MDLPITLAPPLYLAAVLALGIAAQWLAWRLKIPAIVLLLFLGFGWGYVAGRPEDYLESSILFPMVSLSVGVILFEGGLNLRFREIRETSGVVLQLVSIGLFTTAVLTAVAAHYLVDFSWPMAALLGALLTVSGPTVILPLLRQVRPERKLGSVVKWEGIINDPIGAVLAALVYEVVAHPAPNGVAQGTMIALGKTIAIGLGLGLLSGWVVRELMRRYLVPDYLQNPVVLAIVLLLFAISNYLQPESGLITVTVLGMYLANQRDVTIKHVIEFKENLRVLLLSVLFIVLASRIQPSMADLRDVGWGGIALVLFMVLVVRPASVFLSTLGSELTRKQRLFLSWIHPRGIVAAAVATLFAIGISQAQPEMAAEGKKFVLVVFLVVVGTVTIYGLSLGYVARYLGLSREDPQGVLFVGASPLVREVARSLHNEGLSTLLVDTNPQNIALARMDGLPVCYASIGSDFVHEETDLGDLGRLLAMTPNDEVNTLAASEFAEQFGSANVFQFAPHEKTSQRHQRVPKHLRGRILFASDLTEDQIKERHESGFVMKKTTLSEGFTMSHFREKYGDDAILMFVIPDGGRLMVVAADSKYEPKAGDKLIALVPPEKASNGESR
ncbi:cation:proton antiporter [Aeoliella sp. ICT_H6.2]|uniref:Cation:proton antiporter n=1 Tax=Aeoliella straminimaris TaxID=2954799 RepID=A0A9X2F8K3_9BACT|nr:sodium:proton antiporter [Aeoliella straminimaris]MCO6043643.1 cation:proton antiporter [Aeoliella straminimaris]